MYDQTIWQCYTGPLSKVPGPMIARWTNLILKYHTLQGDRMQYIDHLHARYGKCPWMLSLRVK